MFPAVCLQPHFSPHCAVGKRVEGRFPTCVKFLCEWDWAVFCYSFIHQHIKYHSFVSAVSTNCLLSVKIEWCMWALSLSGHIHQWVQYQNVWVGWGVGDWLLGSWNSVLFSVLVSSFWLPSLFWVPFPPLPLCHAIANLEQGEQELKKLVNIIPGSLSWDCWIFFLVTIKWLRHLIMLNF